MARNITISDFLGLNNVLPAEELLRKENFQTIGYYLSKAKNIDIDNNRKPRRRAGYAPFYSGGAHSLWSPENGNICLFREGTTLKSLSEDFLSASTLRTGITGNLSMAYLFLDNKVYYSDGNITGIIENGASRSWGLSLPPSPALSPIPGILPSGNYQVCLTYVRNDGQESGASESTIITLTNSTSGIRIGGIVASNDSTVTKINIYVTRRDSELFYKTYTLSNASQTIDRISEDGLSAIPLKTQFLSPPPPGQILEYYGGMIHVGSFDVDWYTEPFKYELCNMGTNFIQFEDDLTLVGAVDDGIYFGTDNEITFALGDHPKKFQFLEKADYGAIFGTMQKIKRPDVGQNEVMATLITFASKKGICIGGKGGELINKTRDIYDYNPTDSGAGFIRREAGIDQYLVTLGRSTEANPTVVTYDFPAMEVVDMGTGGAITVSMDKKVIKINSSSAQSLTLPSGILVIAGMYMKIVKEGAGRVTIICPAGVTINDSLAGGTIYCDDTGMAELNIMALSATKWIASGSNTWVTT
jgi:hypothetical protein